MGRLLNNLRRGSSAHTVEMGGDGFTILRRTGEAEMFDRLAREVLNGAGDDYVAFPTADRYDPMSYERVFIIPIE